MADDGSVSRRQLADELGLPIEFLGEELSDEARLKQVEADLAELTQLVEADLAGLTQLISSLDTNTSDPCTFG
jgi:hypothetical protein